MTANLELNLIFKNKIIKELLSKYDYIKSLIKEKKLNFDKKDENTDNFDYCIVENEKKCVEILQRLKFIYHQFIYNFSDNLNNLSDFIENCLINRKIDIENDIKFDFTLKKMKNGHQTNNSSKKLRNNLQQFNNKNNNYKIKKYNNSSIKKSFNKIEEKNSEENSSIYSSFVDGINNKIYSQSTTLSKEKRNSLLLNIEQKDNNLSDLFPFNKSSSKKIPINNLIKDTKINRLSENKKYKHLLGIKRNISFEEELK